MGSIRYIVYLFPVFTAAALFCFFLWYAGTQRAPLARQLDPERAKKRLSFAGTCHPMVKKDALPLLLITLVYACAAFFQLGDMSAPQSARDFGDGQAQTFVLPEEVQASKIWYFSGLGSGNYQVEISADGVNWLSLWQRKDDPEDPEEVTGWYWADPAGYGNSYAMPQKYNQLFKWNELTIDNPQYIRYLRITGQAGKELLELCEVAFFDLDGSFVDLSDPTNPLLDEQELVPEHISFLNSAYFDEIYHPRTAYENIRGVYPYEVTHPPLGKLIMSVGIRLFGMTPFGWRFMGALFGVAMLPLLYVFLKNLFGRTAIAACGTILLAADFMHLTQTRLATIDTYAFFFILLMYWFMYRWLVLPAGTPFRRCALPLFLSGLFWGIGAASKWTVIYGCTGLVVLYFLGLGLKLRDWPETETGEKAPGRLKWTFQTLAWSVLVFALIPAVIYTLSYLPYAAASGEVSLKNLIGEMWDNQKYMLSYHSGVTDTHPYSSRWYQWLFDARPILYYMDNSVSGFTTRFAAFVNPVVCWGGLLAVVACGFHGIVRRSGRALFILIGYLAQLVPWFFIGRITFAYHYFPSVLFLILALCYVFHTLARQEDLVNWRPPVYALTGGAVLLFVLFYPALVGIPYPTWYGACVLKWFPAWPF